MIILISHSIRSKNPIQSIYRYITQKNIAIFNHFFTIFLFVLPSVSPRRTLKIIALSLSLSLFIFLSFLWRLMTMILMTSHKEKMTDSGNEMKDYQIKKWRKMSNHVGSDFFFPVARKSFFDLNAYHFWSRNNIHFNISRYIRVLTKRFGKVGARDELWI